MELQTIKSVENLEFCTEVRADVLPLESLKDHCHAENYSYQNKVPHFQVRAASYVLHTQKCHINIYKKYICICIFYIYRGRYSALSHMAGIILIAW